jgi:hypothetical protein
MSAAHCRCLFVCVISVRRLRDVHVTHVHVSVEVLVECSPLPMSLLCVCDLCSQAARCA